MKLSTLKKQAAACTARRGHCMKWGDISQHNGGQWLTGTCRRCHSYVQILTRPEPNQISIGGDALAINCKPRKTSTSSSRDTSPQPSSAETTTPTPRWTKV